MKVSTWREFSLITSLGAGSNSQPTTTKNTNTAMYGRVGPMVDRGRGIYAFVLHETEMPALILEAGMIVNRKEEVILSSPVRRATIVRAVVDALKKFLRPERSQVQGDRCAER